MASRIQGITVEIGGDTTKLQNALKGVNGQIKSTQSQLKDVNKLLKLDPGNTELLAQKHKLLSLDQMAELFQRDKSTISRHIKKIFEERELDKFSVVANFATTASDGKTYHVDYYNPNAEESILFFKQVQNKMHWAAHKHTAAEIVFYRADSEKENMGLTSWEGKQIKKSDSEIAKNYLNNQELDALNKIVSAYLDIAEVRALNHEPMYMKDWLETIDDYLKMTRREILTTKGSISHKQAIEKAHAEYDKYKKKQDELLSNVEKDFIHSIEMLEQIEDSNI
ncbi:MAG: virulence RhuM family protein [Lachnospiraceae bacterium]|nr:virulence RhuM family protein [Lachnospiraceae bacterium]